MFKPKSYKRYKPEGEFDAIIIGSGMGGMAAGSLLAQNGFRVLILEQHYTAGGFTHTFKRGDWEWDVGLHYIGEVHKPDSFMRIVFDAVSDGSLHWNEMSNVYDKVVISGRQFDFPKGVSNFKAYLKKEFPGEEKAIDDYLDLIFKAANSAMYFFMDKTLPNWLSAIVGPYLRSKFFKYSDRTTLEVLKSITKNELLIGVLTAQFGDYGCPPSESSFAIHAMVVKHYLSGGAYPVGGSQAIGNAIFPMIEKNRGEVLVGAKVKEVVIEGGKAVGVKMEDDKIIRGKHIISNAGAHLTFKHLLPKQYANYLEGFGKLKTSPSHLCLYIGVDENIDPYLNGNGNYWIYPNANHDATMKNFTNNLDGEFPVMYISFPSSKDPAWKAKHPDKSTIEIISVANYDWFKEWENERWKHRGAEYEAIKEKFSQRMLAELYKVVPQLEGKISFYELSTPLSTKLFAAYEKGEIYGLDHTPERFRNKGLRISTPIKNFYLTGQDVISVGIGGALISGLLTAQFVSGKNMWSHIKKKKAELKKNK